MFKKLLRACLPNPLDQRLKKVRGNRFLVTWNRGLGDIALGLYALVHRIRSFVPDAEITFLTRADLKEGFSLLKNVNALIGADWKRGKPFDLDATLHFHGLKREDFNCILENPDVTQWLCWQLGNLTPKLAWKAEWDGLWKKFPLETESTYVCVHIQTETQYHYDKNWPLSSWNVLFKRLKEDPHVKIILFGFEPTPPFEEERIIDLRGRTHLFELLSIVKNRCQCLIVPDSGVLSLTYYLDHSFPLKIISLWSDPRQGVLKQKVSSPNPLLRHYPLIGKGEKISAISVDAVMEKYACP